MEIFIRPFKKIETADFEVPKPGYKDLWTDFCFGITPEEGIVLPLLKSIDYNTALSISKKTTDESTNKGETEILLIHADALLASVLGNNYLMYTLGQNSWDEFERMTPLIVEDHNMRLDAEINGPKEENEGISNTLNVYLPDIRAEALSALLEHKYHCVVSLGSACSTRSVEQDPRIIRFYFRYRLELCRLGKDRFVPNVTWQRLVSDRDEIPEVSEVLPYGVDARCEFVVDYHRLCV